MFVNPAARGLLSLPARGLTLRDKQAVNAALLRSGAAISEINAVRKHLSAIKGGHLAAAAFPARVVTLVTDRIRVALPAAFTAGPTTAILYAILPDSNVLSNPIDFSLP